MHIWVLTPNYQLFWYSPGCTRVLTCRRGIFMMYQCKPDVWGSFPGMAGAAAMEIAPQNLFVWNPHWQCFACALALCVHMERTFLGKTSKSFALLYRICRARLHRKP